MFMVVALCCMWTLIMIHQVLQDLIISDTFIESIYIEITSMAKKYLLLCIYRPPNGSLLFSRCYDRHSLVSVWQEISRYLYIAVFNLNLSRSNDNTVNEFIN